MEDNDVSGEEQRRPAAPWRRWWRLGLAGIFFLVFSISAFMVVSDLAAARQEARIFQRLTGQVDAARKEDEQPPASALTPEDAGSAPEGDTPPEDASQKEKLLAAYAALQAENPDFFGWLTIAGTVIDYPVMYTPEDPEYYIHRDFEGNKSRSGVPFLDGNSFEGCGNYLIYGHHMKNGTMFASLLDYADPEFWREHPTIRFDTPQALTEYQVMAAFYSRVYRENEKGVFRYYQYADLSDRTVFEDYAARVKAAARYDTGVTAAYGDQLLTLSTCGYHTDNGRFVVVARAVQSPPEASEP